MRISVVQTTRYYPYAVLTGKLDSHRTEKTREKRCETYRYS